ncbi:nucleolar protein 58-like [Palaemon carinicauda]|uniref:nucleolar protein 58-like n=1 Tax=Palaemon carinicauda TaxID=392227 RepID=UPI0035B5F9A0
MSDVSERAEEDLLAGGEDEDQDPNVVEEEDAVPSDAPVQAPEPIPSTSSALPTELGQALSSIVVMIQQMQKENSQKAAAMELPMQKIAASRGPPKKLNSQFSKMEDLNIKTVKSVLLFKERQEKLEARKEENLLVYRTNFIRDSKKEDGNSSTRYKREGSRGFKGEDKRFEERRDNEERGDNEERRDKKERRHNTKDRQNKRSKKGISGKKAQFYSDKDCENESEEEELSGKVAKTRTDTKAMQ